MSATTEITIEIIIKIIASQFVDMPLTQYFKGIISNIANARRAIKKT